MKDIVLNKQQLLQLIKGASLFTTGGGVPYEDQLKTIKNLDNPRVSLSTLENLPENEYVITAGEIGPANAPQIKKKDVAKKILQSLEKITDKKIVGIYPPEIGQESVVIETAFLLNLPIIDFDPVGFRAVPYLDISIFNLKNIPFSYTPLVACNDLGEIYIINGETEYQRTEKILREMTSLATYNTIFFLGGLISVKQLKEKKLLNNSLSRALGYGNIQTLDKLIDDFESKLVIEATITKKTEKEQKGFLFEEISAIDKAKQKIRLVILNEALFLYNSSNVCIASVPERILLINPQKMSGKPSGSFEIGEKISIIVLPPEKEWRSTKAKKLFGPERFKEII